MTQTPAPAAPEPELASLAATSAGAPVFPPGRYGRRRAPGRPARARRMKFAFLLAGVLIMTGIAVRLYVQYGSEEFTTNVVSYSNVTGSSITVTFTVGKPKGVAASCTLQAFTYEDSQVGQAQALVPAAGTQARVTYTLRTTARAYAVEIPVCDEIH